MSSSCRVRAPASAAGLTVSNIPAGKTINCGFPEGPLGSDLETVPLIEAHAGHDLGTPYTIYGAMANYHGLSKSGDGDSVACKSALEGDALATLATGVRERLTTVLGEIDELELQRLSSDYLLRIHCEKRRNHRSAALCHHRP